MMGRLRRTGRRRQDENGILPLINVVFLLLIFVMLTGRMAAEDPGVVQPPVSSRGDPLAGDAVELTILADGSLRLLGRTITAAELRGSLPSAEPGAPRRVRIRADAAADSRQLVALIPVLRAAGVEAVELMAVPRR